MSLLYNHKWNKMQVKAFSVTGAIRACALMVSWSCDTGEAHTLNSARLSALLHACGRSTSSGLVVFLSGLILRHPTYSYVHCVLFFFRRRTIHIQDWEQSNGVRPWSHGRRKERRMDSSRLLGPWSDHVGDESRGYQLIDIQFTRWQRCCLTHVEQ